MKSETGHSTQKPVECMKRPIENNSSPGQALYEPFSGSGTTIIAAEMTGRVVCGIEIAPAYVDVAVKRWQDFTGRQAPHLMVTDPPYGVNYDPDCRNAAKFGDGKGHSGRASGKVVNDDRADWRETWALGCGSCRRDRRACRAAR
jgi:DNA modification methylase